MNVVDLIGTPYREMDCRQLALVALERAGIDVPGRGAWEAARVEMDSDAFAEVLSDTGDRWALLHDRSDGAVPQSLELLDGDVLVSRPSVVEEEQVTRRVHLSVVCDGPGRLAVSTSQRMGAAVVRIGLIGPVTVYRRQP